MAKTLRPRLLRISGVPMDSAAADLARGEINQLRSLVAAFHAAGTSIITYHEKTGGCTKASCDASVCPWDRLRIALERTKEAL